MGSASIDNCTDNGTVGEKLYEESRSKRPDFYPCEACGRKFTMLAMAVHKRSCLETEGCQCSVCKSGAKKFKWSNTERKNEVPVDDLYCNRASLKNKISARVKPRIRDLLTAKSFPMKNGVIAEENLISFKLVENDIIDKMVGYNSAKSEDSTLKYSESAAFNDHKYVSLPPEMSENSNSVNNKPQSSPDQFSVFLKLNDKVDHDCTRKIFCSVCNEHIYWETFGLHVIEHCEILDNNDLKCPGCDKVYNKPACILTHFIFHILSHPEHCDVCYCSDSKCIEAKNRAVEEHCYDNSPYYCYICLTRFSHNQTVVNHMRLHTNEMPFTCKECNRSFRQIGNLQRHMTTHRGDRPHKCPDCCRSFADPATLRNHLRVHTGETPFVCTICKRGFTQVGNLKRHMAVHLAKDASSAFSSAVEMVSDESTASDINPPDDIKCNPNSMAESVESKIATPDLTVNNSIESPTFVNDINAKNRKRRKNQKMKVFTCKICKKVYAWHHDLVVHFRTHTGEKPFECDICGKRFAQSGAVRIHKDRHHPESITEQDSS